MRNLNGLANALVPPDRLRIGQELAAAPYDVELQRIYADVLLEEGGVHAIRGELIQLELAGRDAARRMELAASLKRVREARGLGGLGGEGLARDWNCSADQLAALGSMAYAEEPLLRWITIEIGKRDVELEMRKLAATPELARVRCLCIIGNPAARPGPKGLATLLASPHWPQLDSLSLPNCRIHDAGAELLARTSSLSGLTWLTLWSNAILSDGVIALARSPVFAKVRYLNLWSNRPGPRGMAALAAPENRMPLVQLDLDEVEQKPELVASIVKRFPGIEIRSKPPEPEQEPWPFDRDPFG